MEKAAVEPLERWPEPGCHTGWAEPGSLGWKHQTKPVKEIRGLQEPKTSHDVQHLDRGCFLYITPVTNLNFGLTKIIVKKKQKVIFVSTEFPWAPFESMKRPFQTPNIQTRTPVCFPVHLSSPEAASNKTSLQPFLCLGFSPTSFYILETLVLCFCTKYTTSQSARSVVIKKKKKNMFPLHVFCLQTWFSRCNIQASLHSRIRHKGLNVAIIQRCCMFHPS